MPDKALVVESDPTTQKQIAGLLTRRGFRVECVDNGDRAVGRFVATLPSLVVCAEQPSGLSGLQVCQQIRTLGTRIRILLLFNQPLDSWQKDELCADVGCDHVICRPFKVGDLVDALIAWGLGEEIAEQEFDFGIPESVPQSVLPPPTPTPLSPDQTAASATARTASNVEPVLLTNPKPPQIVPDFPDEPFVVARSVRSTFLEAPKDAQTVTATPIVPASPTPSIFDLPPPGHRRDAEPAANAASNIITTSVVLPDGSSEKPSNVATSEAATNDPVVVTIDDAAEYEPVAVPTVEAAEYEPIAVPTVEAAEYEPIAVPTVEAAEYEPIAVPTIEAAEYEPIAVPTVEAAEYEPIAVPTVEAAEYEPIVIPTVEAATQEPIVIPTVEAAEYEPIAVPTVEAATQEPIVIPTVAAATQEPIVIPTVEAAEHGLVAVPTTEAAAPEPIAADSPAPEIATAALGDSFPMTEQPANLKAQGATPSLLPSGVPRYGDLAGMPLPRLLYELYVGTYFGVLQLRRRDAARTIYFWAGVPVRVDTDQLTESLGAVLKEDGRITDEQLQAAKRHAVEHGCAIGIALVETGAVHERDLLDALAKQNRQKLINTFAWRDGIYEARDDTSFANNTVLCDINPLRVIWRGVCEHYEVSPLLDFLSRQRDRFIVATDLFPLQAEMLTEPLNHLTAARVLDGKTTVEAALLADAAHTVEIARAIYVLLVTDMIRASQNPGDAAPVIVKEDAPTSSTLVDYTALLEASERIACEYLRVKGKDHFAILEVERDATTIDIDAAHAHAAQRLEADRALAGLPPEDHKRLREITRIQTEAHVTLADPNRRMVYARTLIPQGDAADTVDEQTKPTQDRRQALFVAEAAYREGQKLLEANKPNAAREFFLDAVETHPGESTYRVAVAQAILAGGHDEAENPRAVAFSYIDEALRLDPANLVANIEAAKLLAMDGALDQALVYLDKVLKRAPDHAVAQRLLREIKNDR